MLTVLQAVTSSLCPEVCANPTTKQSMHATDKVTTATVQKIITEVLANDQGMSFAKETRDLLIECCVEFITMISSEANEIAEKDAKKTIACEHIVKALEELGFNEYVPDLLEVAQQFKSQQAVSGEQTRKKEDMTLTCRQQSREKKQSKIEQSGMSEEELLRQQEELFRSANEKFNAGPAEPAAEPAA